MTISTHTSRKDSLSSAFVAVGFLCGESPRSELLDFHAAVAGVNAQRSAPAVQSSMQFVAIAASALVVIHRNGKRAVHMSVAGMNVKIGGKTLRHAQRHRAVRRLDRRRL